MEELKVKIYRLKDNELFDEKGISKGNLKSEDEFLTQMLQDGWILTTIREEKDHGHYKKYAYYYFYPKSLFGCN